MSIICTVSEKEVRLARKRMFSAIKKAVSDNQPFDLNQYMIDEYAKIFDLVPDLANKHATAIEYARIAPQFIEQGIPKIPALFQGLMGVSFDFNNLTEVLKITKNDVTGLSATAELLQIGQDAVSDLIEDNTGVHPVSVAPEVPAPTEATAEATTPYVRRVFNFLGQTLSAMRSVPYHRGGQAKSRDANVTLAPGPLFDEWGEDRNNPNNFYYKVKRQVLQQMNDSGVYDSRELKIDNTPVYLTAKSIATIEEKDLGDDIDLTKDPERTGVLLVLTDEFGDPFRFDEDGKQTYDGKIAYYKMRSTDKIFAGGEPQLTKADQERIRSMARLAYKNLAPQAAQRAAREEYIRQLELIRDMRKHINTNKEQNMVQSYINGGTVGFAVRDESLNTPIRNLNFEGQDFSPTWARKDEPSMDIKEGHTYFYVDGFYGQPIEVERPTIDSVVNDGKLFKDKLISLLVDDIQDAQGSKLSAAKRQDLIEFFIMTSPNTIQLIPNNDAADTYALLVTTGGVQQRLNTTSPEGRAASTKILDTYFATFGPIREVTDAGGRVTIAEKPLGAYTKADQNKIVKKTVQGVTKYFVIEKPHLNIRGKKDNKNYLGTQFDNVDLTTDSNGQVVMTSNKEAYNDFIFNNFRVKYILDKEKRIRKYDAYFTFQPTDKALDELYGMPITDKLEETMEEAAPEQAAMDDPLDDLPDHLPTTNLDDQLDELNKRSGQKAIEKKATNEQIAAAKLWYETSPLRHVIPFEALFTMVNTMEPDSVASWSVSGITLYRGADYSDVYHEAWHGFTQTFLSKEQKINLYNEVSKKSGSFTDHNGRRVSFKTASYLQIEEYLAEDFRKYMLNGGKTKANAPVRNSLFRQILNALKALFSNSTISEIIEDERADKTISEIYEKLRVGNLQEYTFTQENVMFGELNKGMQAFDISDPVQAMSYEKSKLVVDSIDSYISDWIDWRNSGLRREDMNRLKQIEEKLLGKLPLSERQALQAELDSYGPKKTYKFSAQVFKNPKYLVQAYQFAKDQIAAEYTATRTQMAATTNEATKATLKKKAQLLYWTYKNFGDTTTLANNEYENTDLIKGVIGYHMHKSERYLNQEIKVALDYEGMDESQLFVKGKSFDRPGNDVAMKDLAKEELVYLIRGLQKVDKDGKKTRNELGAYELVEFQEVWNRLARVLQNTVDGDLVYAKLEAEKDAYPVIKQLLDKLGPLMTGEREDATQWTNFLAIFTMPRIPLIQMTLTKHVDKSGNETYQSNIGQAFNNDTKVGRRWETEFHMNPDPRYTTRDKDNNPILNLKAILEDFSNGKDAPANKQLRGRERDFLHAIGWKITDNVDAIEGLKRIGDIEWIYAQIKYLQSRQARIKSFEDIWREYDPVNITKNGQVIKQVGARSSMESRYKNVQRYHARYGDEESNFMVTNAEGNTQFEHSLNNSMTIIVNTVNSATDYWDLIDKPHMAHMNIETNPYAKASNWLNSIFILDDSAKGTAKYGQRRRESDLPNAPFVQINYTNLSGVLLNEEEGDLSVGVASAKADEVSKMILDFHLTTQLGQPELMRHADKSSSYSAYMKHIYNKNRAGISSKYIENTEFLTPNSTRYNSEVFTLLLPHMNAEFKRIKTMRSISPSIAQDIDFNYWKAGQKFVAFDDVFALATKNALINLTDDVQDLEEYLAQDTNEARALRATMLSDMSDYFEKQVTAVSEKFSDNEFIADNVYKTINREAIKAGVTGLTKVQAREALVKSFVYNSWINNMETIGFFYGDLALFNHQKEEFHKRNAGMGSTGNIYRTDSAMQHLINNTIKRPYTYSKGGNYKAFDGTMESAVIKDSNVKSVYYDSMLDIYTEHFKNVEKLSTKKAKAKAVDVLDAYSGRKGGQMNEGDAQGWVSFDSYRIMKIAEGSWSDSQEAKYNDILDGRPIDPGQVATFFPTVKAQYFGPLQNTISGTGVSDRVALPVTAMHKFSLFPLIPTVIADTNLQALHEKMMHEGVDYTLFESGSKVGTITKEGNPDDFYVPGTRGEVSTTEFTKNTIFLKYLKNQLEIAPKYKGSVIFSTQMRKLIEDGLIENGVPTDFEPKTKNIRSRIKKWDSIQDENAKKNASRNYKLVKEYEDNIRLLTEIKKKELLDEMKWTVSTVKGVEVADGKIEDLLNFVKDKLTMQDLADHEIDFLSIKDGELKRDLSLSLSAEKIEKLLNALVIKRLVKQTVKGEGLIQISGALFESFGSTDRDYTKPSEEDITKYGTNDLPTYHRNADGTTAAMKVKVALQGDFLKLLNAKHKDGEKMSTIARLNESIQDEEWMKQGRNRDMVTMVGVRIPVQGLNSMEFMEVYEFLPAEAGNIIIPPAEIVAKSGSDFDIDKLSVMMPNLSRGRRSDFTRMFNYTEADAKKEYQKYVEAKKSPLLKGSGAKINRETGEREILDYFKFNDLLALMGANVYGLDEDIEALLLEEGDIKSEEDFIKELIGSKSVENDIIDNIKAILELKENFVNLTQPNSTNIVKPIADELAPDVMAYSPFDTVNGEGTRENEDGKVIISATRALEIPYNLYKHATNNIGKQTLGLGAVDNTYNTIFNRIGFYLNPTSGMTTKEYDELTKIKKAKAKGKRLAAGSTGNKRTQKIKAGLSAEEQKYYFMKAPTKEQTNAYNDYYRQKLFLPHNVVEVDGEDGISLSHDRDVTGEHRIADVINQLLNGWVDIAKDTWIFNIQGNKEVSPTLLFLLQAGVPAKTAIYFASMPMVRDYVDAQRGAKSTFAEPLGIAPQDNNPNFFRGKAREVILTDPRYGFNITLDKLGGKSKGTIRAAATNTIIEEVLEDGYFNQGTMRKKIAKYAKDPEAYKYTDEDRAMFLHYLEAENMAMPIRDVKLKMNFDTSKSGTLFEAQDRILMKEELKQDARIPMEMVEKILTDSPIGSFYVQPFQLAIWKDLFPLRNHPMITTFLLSKMKEAGTKEDISSTFGDAMVFANAFRSDLVNFIFQNSIRSFDHNAKTYRGYEVKQEVYGVLTKLDNLKDGPKNNRERIQLEKELGKLMGIPTSDVTSLRQGISRAIKELDNGTFIYEDQLFVDKDQLQKDFELRLFMKDTPVAGYKSYGERGLATVNNQAFRTLDEYYNFVYERETLRKTQPYGEIKDTGIYKATRTKVMSFVANKQKKDESSEAYTARMDSMAYETYLRDTALTNTYNHWALFQSDNSYGDQFTTMRLAYPHLVETFGLMDQLSVGSSGGLTNIKLNDNFLDGDMINVLHEQLLELMDQNVSKAENQMDSKLITDFFRKFPIVAFLQSGMNTTSAFSMTRIVPQDTFLRMIEQPVKEYVKHMDAVETQNKADDSNISPEVLEVFYDKFVSANKFNKRREKIRGKRLSVNYRLNDSIKAFKLAVKNKDKSSEQIKAELLKAEQVDDVFALSTPLVEANKEGVLGYRGNSIGITTVTPLSALHPDKLFVYNFATGSIHGASTNDHTFFSENIENSLGLPTLNTYGAGPQGPLADVDGDISEANRIAIDTAIAAIKADGRTPVFNQDGYGQQMIGKVGNKTNVGKKTFLYLSKKLFEEFNFINPQYLSTGTGVQDIQSTQPISDQQVLDMMEFCITV